VLVNHGDAPFTVRRTDRIAQMIVAPVARVRWAVGGELPDSSRGAGGFGHTGS
jgi:dUTP pyrophosphatase